MLPPTTRAATTETKSQARAITNTITLPS
jgi:hypothetical protein